MKRIVVIVLAALLLAGCEGWGLPANGDDALRPGIVEGRRETLINGVKGWKVTVKMVDGQLYSTFVDQRQYDACPKGSAWPECGR